MSPRCRLHSKQSMAQPQQPQQLWYPACMARWRVGECAPLPSRALPSPTLFSRCWCWCWRGVLVRPRARPRTSVSCTTMRSAASQGAASSSTARACAGHASSTPRQKLSSSMLRSTACANREGTPCARSDSASLSLSRGLSPAHALPRALSRASAGCGRQRWAAATHGAARRKACGFVCGLRGQYRHEEEGRGESAPRRPASPAPSHPPRPHAWW